jgi:hypothetical protein
MCPPQGSCPLQAGGAFLKMPRPLQPPFESGLVVPTVMQAKKQPSERWGLVQNPPFPILKLLGSARKTWRLRRKAGAGSWRIDTRDHAKNQELKNHPRGRGWCLKGKNRLSVGPSLSCCCYFFRPTRSLCCMLKHLPVGTKDEHGYDDREVPENDEGRDQDSFQ